NRARALPILEGPALGWTVELVPLLGLPLAHPTDEATLVLQRPVTSRTPQIGWWNRRRRGSHPLIGLLEGRSSRAWPRDFAFPRFSRGRLFEQAVDLREQRLRRDRFDEHDIGAGRARAIHLRGAAFRRHDDNRHG